MKFISVRCRSLRQIGFIGLFLIFVPCHTAEAQTKPAIEVNPAVQELLDKGDQAAEENMWQVALSHFNAALAKARSLGDQRGEGEALSDLGDAYDALHLPNRALERYQQSLPLLRQAADKEVEATTLYNIGALYAKGNQPRIALDYYQQALSLKRELQDRAGEARTLNNIGYMYFRLGQPREAMGYYQQSLPIRRAEKDIGGEAVTLNNMGLVYANTGQSQKALQHYQQALELKRAIKDKGGEANTLTNIGALFVQLRQPQKALNSYLEALALFETIGDKNNRAVTLTGIGSLYADMGQLQKALEYLQQALPLTRERRDQQTEATALHDVASVYSALGRFQQALKYYEHALSLRKSLEDRAGQAATLNNIGSTLLQIGQTQQALEYYKQALTWTRSVQNRSGEATVLHNIGSIYWELDQRGKAWDYYSQALLLRRETGDHAGEAITLVRLGEILAARGQIQQALNQYQQALKIMQEAQDRENEAITWVAIGDAHAVLSRSQQAPQDYQRALGLFRAIGDRIGEAATWDHIASWEEQHGRLTAAEVYLRKSLNVWESVRAALGADAETKMHYIFSKLSSYHGYIHLLLKSPKKYAAKAFLWTQKTKARALLDLVQGNHEPSQRIHPTITLKQIVAFLPSDTALLEYVALQTQNGMRATDHTVLFVVTVRERKAIVKVYSIHKTRQELNQLANAFRMACATPSTPFRPRGVESVHSDVSRDPAGMARRLYNLLVAPAERQLVGKRHLLICPSGPLGSLPFQALLLKERTSRKEKFLLQKYEVTYAYSAAGAWSEIHAARDLHRRKPSKSVIVFANPNFGGPDRLPSTMREAVFAGGVIAHDGLLPRLPGTQKEAEAIQRTFSNAAIYVQGDAQESIAKRLMDQFRYVHFATHGLLNEVNPLQSSIALAQPPAGSQEDGFLTAREILDLRLAAEMIVLSACNSGRGQKRVGEGIIGLTWALFAAGVPTQVVSQWSVADDSTATLMQHFYWNLGKKMPKGAALRQATLDLLRDGRHSHPFYWAPFILVGDWN